MTWATLPQWLSPVYQREGGVAVYPPFRYSLCKNALLQTTTSETQHNMSKAKRLFSLGDARRAFKNVFHALRFAYWAECLAERGFLDPVKDVQVHADLFLRSVERSWPDWAALEAEFRPMLRASLSRLEALCQVRLGKEICTVDDCLARADSLELLQRELAVNSCCKETMSLVALHLDPIFGDRKHPIAKQINGMLVSGSTLIASSYGVMEEWKRAHNTQCFLEKIDGGQLVIVFYRDDAWHVASKYSPDASDRYFVTVDESSCARPNYYYHSRFPAYDPFNFFEQSSNEAYFSMSHLSPNGNPYDRSQGYFPLQSQTTLSSSSPTSQRTTRIVETCLRTKFWEMWKQRGMQLPSGGDATSWVYFFECVSPLVAPLIAGEPREEIWCHGARHVVSRKEMPYETLMGAHPSWRFVPILHHVTEANARTFVDTLDVRLMQGVVALNRDGTRSKLVSPAYRSLKKIVLGFGSIVSETATHRLCFHLTCTLSPEAIASLVLQYPQLEFPFDQMERARVRVWNKLAECRDSIGAAAPEQKAATIVQSLTKNPHWRNAIFAYLRDQSRTALSFLSAKRLWLILQEIESAFFSQ